MRKSLLVMTLSLFVIAIMISGCSNSRPERTIENLKAAITGESNASAKYAVFATKARDEGYDTIAKMFSAISKSENIHATNHLEILIKLGIIDFTPNFDSIKTKSTIENLQSAIDGETYEFTTMYPEFIRMASEEKVEGAIISFNWANSTEMKHKEFYQKAHDTIKSAAKENGLAYTWVVCPKCGNTFSVGSIDEICGFCMTPKDKFLPF